MMNLQTATGKLTSYGFACGYIERRGGFTLSREHNVYHVKGFGAGTVPHWETARTLTEARTLLRQLDNLYGLCGDARKRDAR